MANRTQLEKWVYLLDLDQRSDDVSMPMTIEALEDLPRTPATDVKKQGWRGLMKTVGRVGKVVVTNHNAPEAVILSTHEYGAIVVALREAASRGDPALDALRRRFDERLAALDAPDAADRLRGLMRAPVRLNGVVKAGDID